MQTPESLSQAGRTWSLGVGCLQQTGNRRVGQRAATSTCPVSNSGRSVQHWPHHPLGSNDLWTVTPVADELFMATWHYIQFMLYSFFLLVGLYSLTSYAYISTETHDIVNWLAVGQCLAHHYIPHGEHPSVIFSVHIFFYNSALMACKQSA